MSSEYVVKYVCHGHRVKVKVTETKTCDHSHVSAGPLHYLRSDYRKK